jgi:hypothetical protein
MRRVHPLYVAALSLVVVVFLFAREAKVAGAQEALECSVPRAFGALRAVSDRGVLRALSDRTASVTESDRDFFFEAADGTVRKVSVTAIGTCRPAVIVIKRS